MGYRMGERYKVRRLKGGYVTWRVGVLSCMFGVMLAGFAVNAVWASRTTPTAQQRKPKQEIPVFVATAQNKTKLKVEAPVLSTTTITTNAQLPINCAKAPAPHLNLAQSYVPQLRKLAEYERVCGAAVAEKASFFAPTPATLQQAKVFAADTAYTLQEFSRRGVAPLIFLEPVNEQGNLNFALYRAGAYDAALDAYFAELKARGITSEMMGTWVPFPEGNIPVWDTVLPEDYVANVTKTIQFQKKYFPASKAALLLDSMTYPQGTSWSGGAYVSLRPYVEGIPRGLVDSMGLQGFPWAPPATEGGAALVDPRLFLQIGHGAEAANILGVKDIWFNTGTFGRAHTGDASRTVVFSPQQRHDILAGVLLQAKALKGRGYHVSVHLFAEDKSGVAEGIDWSYWPQGNILANRETTRVFKSFVREMQAAGLPLWLYDSAK